MVHNKWSRFKTHLRLLIWSWRRSIVVENESFCFVFSFLILSLLKIWWKRPMIIDVKSKMTMNGNLEVSYRQSVFVNYLLVRWFCFEVFHRLFVVAHKTDFWSDLTVLKYLAFCVLVSVWIPLLLMGSESLYFVQSDRSSQLLQFNHMTHIIWGTIPWP